jgi:hypothetical protein
MLRKLALEAEVVASEDKGSFSLQIMEGILNATSAEDVFAAQEQGSLSGKDYVDRPFSLMYGGIEWVRSDLEQGLPVYARLTVVDMEDGQERTLTCGGQTFVATLHRLMEINYWEVSDVDSDGVARTFRFQVKPTVGGNTVLLLKPYVMPKAISNGKGKK